MRARDRRARACGTAAVHAALAAGLLTACGDRNLGDLPPADQLFFPSSMMMDPRVEGTPEQPAKYLFVSNANSDLSYNAGTIAAVDLDAFWAAWFSEELGAMDPYCGPDRCVQPASAELDGEFPCRRLSTMPQVVECDESDFVVSTVHLGSFGTTLGYSFEGPGDQLRLLIPVRGDPSVTFVEVEGSPSSPPQFRCGQGSKKHDDNRCSDDYRLTHERNDESLLAFGREPFKLLVSPDPDIRLAYVAHSAGGRATLIDLDGIGETIGGLPKPAIVDQALLFDLQGQVIPGGFGLAQRPCWTDPDDPNVPAITKGCTRPLVYGTFRYSRLLETFTGSTPALADEPTPGTPQYCADPDDIGQQGAVICDAQFDNASATRVDGLDTGQGIGFAVFGDVAFGDERGDELYIVQTNPGALLKVDTSLDENGEPLLSLGAPPVEVCAEPTSMAIYDAGVERYALVSCFRSAYVFVIDLESLRVVDEIVAGTGPGTIAVDLGRQAAYVANTLESTITVIDLSVERATRFTEIARIGLQDPFSR